jgi:transposase
MSEKRSELTTKLIVGHKRDGRSVYSKQGKRELAEACLRPGVSVARLALEHGVNANLLRKWITNYRSECSAGVATEEAPAVAAKLLPVLEAKQSTPEACALQATSHAAPNSWIEIVLPEITVRVHGEVNARQLCQVLDCVMARRS